MSGICIAGLGSVQADKNMADSFQRNDVMKHITIRRIILNSINVHKSKKSKKYQPVRQAGTQRVIRLALEYVRKCGRQSRLDRFGDAGRIGRWRPR